MLVFQSPLPFAKSDAAFKINPDGKGSDVRAFYQTKQHVKKVNELSKNSWNIFSQLFQTTTNLEKYKKDLNKIMENIKSADTYQKRYDCSMFMFVYSVHTLLLFPSCFLGVCVCVCVGLLCV